MQDLIRLFEQHGPLLVFVNVLVEQLGAPVPAVPSLLVAGALAAGGSVSWQVVLILAVLGSGMANFTWYLIGRRQGTRILGLMCRISLSPDVCVRRTERIFVRWGVASLLVARFVPGLSSVASPLAGAMGLPAGRFLLFDTLGTAIWAGAAIAAGMLLNRQVEALINALADIGALAGLVIAALFALYIAFRWIERQRLLRFVRIHRIDVLELSASIAAGKAPVIVDVRSGSALEGDARRIPGAIEVDLEELDAKLGHLPLDSAIVLYCACPNDASAARATRTLKRLGYRNARPLAGGVDAWYAALSADAGAMVLIEAAPSAG